ncbi:MAG TPA: hypothetical protein VGR35_02840 [Tepidisphaeraceae bacterium]|nr:hypothetical protein [Tepidisphaeraceae bacterium]
MEPTLRDILWLVCLPALLGAVAMLATRPWRRGRDLGGWGGALAIAGGFAIAFYHMFSGVPPFPPVSAQQWLFFLGAAVVLVAVLQALVRSKWFAPTASALVAGATPYLLLQKVSFLEPRPLWMWIVVGGVVMVAWWGAMELLSRRARGGTLPLLIGVIFGFSGLAIINAHSATLGQVAGSLAVPLVIIAAAAMGTRGGVVLARGGALAVAVFLLGLLLTAHFFADLPVRDLVLLAAAPLAAWAGELPKLGNPDSWKRVVVRTVAVLAILALPAITAISGLQATLDEQYESYSY